MPKPRKLGWVFWIGLLAVGHIMLYAAPLCLGHDPDWLNGFRGNVVAGVLGSLFFLVLGIYLNREIEQLQVETHDVVFELKKIQDATRQQTSQIERMQAATLKLVEDRERQVKSQETYDCFIRFLSRETYHNIRLPKLKRPSEPLGLQYRIAPVREHGQPRRRTTEMSEVFVISVDSIAYRDQMEPVKLREYDSSPIKVGEYYFCGFYNGAWHLGLEDHHLEHEFYLSGKVGQIERVTSANDFVGENNPPEGSKSLGTIVVTTEGVLARSGQGGARVELFEALGRRFYVKINSAPPKLLDLTVMPPEVEKLDGYFATPEARDRFRSTLLEQIKGSVSVPTERQSVRS